MQLMGGHQELHPAHLGYPLGGQHQRDRLRLRIQVPKPGQCRPRGRLGKDLVIRPEAAAKVGCQRLQRRAVLVHQKQNRCSHARLRCDGRP
jgi:hypothetical protein